MARTCSRPGVFCIWRFGARTHPPTIVEHACFDASHCRLLPWLWERNFPIGSLRFPKRANEVAACPRTCILTRFPICCLNVRFEMEKPGYKDVAARSCRGLKGLCFCPVALPSARRQAGRSVLHLESFKGTDMPKAGGHRRNLMWVTPDAIPNVTFRIIISGLLPAKHRRRPRRRCNRLLVRNANQRPSWASAVVRYRI